MRQKKFTLTELLVVIGIIMILAMIAFPAISSVRKKMQITKAKSDIASITAALQQVQNIYSNFRGFITPSGSELVQVGDTGNGLGKVNSTAHYQTLFNELIAPPASPRFNHRKIRMLDNRKHKDDTNGNYHGWLDPWGHEYIIYIDHDFDGSITVNSADTGNGDAQTLSKSVFVYSMGENGVDNNAQRYVADVSSNRSAAQKRDDITMDN